MCGWHCHGSRYARYGLSPSCTCLIFMSGSYGSLARFREVQRLFSVSGSTVVGTGGDVADARAIEDLLDDLEYGHVTLLVSHTNRRENDFADDGHNLSPGGVYTFLTRVMYNRYCLLCHMYICLLYVDAPRWTLSGTLSSSAAFRRVKPSSAMSTSSVWPTKTQPLLLAMVHTLPW